MTIEKFKQIVAFNNLKTDQKYYIPILLFDKKLINPIVIVDFLEFVFIFIRLYSISSISLYLVFIAFVLLFCVAKSFRIKKYEIYRFTAGSMYESSYSPRLDKDFYINLKNGNNKRRRVNLLETNLYICDNNNILLTRKNKGAEIIDKNDIESLQIKNAYIVYDEKWIKL